VKIERENAVQQQLKQHTEKLGCTGLALHEARDLVIEMLYANLEASWIKLQNSMSSSSKAGGGVSEAEFESILVDSHWVCHEHMLALMRTYACDAGIDAAMVVADMWQCIQRPGFSEARFPAAMLVVVSTLIHRLRNLQSRFLESDEAARQKNGSAVARTENERPAGHLDQEVIAHDLEACGFTVACPLVSRLHLLYCSHTGQWTGYLDYQRFLKDLRYTGKEGARSGTAVCNPWLPPPVNRYLSVKKQTVTDFFFVPRHRCRSHRRWWAEVLGQALFSRFKCTDIKKASAPARVRE